MNSTQIILIILGVHLVLVIAYLVISTLLRRNRLRGEYLLPVILLPVAGILIILTIETLHAAKLEGMKQVELDEMTLGTDIYWKTLRESKEDTNVVPLEEALAINDVKTRRKLLLDTMFDDPRKYLDLLSVARRNDDPETTHYATTTISKIQSNYQMELQKRSVEHYASPENIPALDAYLEVLQRYIDSGLLDDYLMNRQLVQLHKLLEHKLTLVPHDFTTLLQKLRSEITMRDYPRATETSRELQQHWPEEENTWLETVRLNVEGSDYPGLERTLDAIRHQNIVWSRTGYDQISHWLVAVPEA